MDALIMSMIPAGVDPRWKDIVTLILSHKISAAFVLLFASGLGAPLLAWLLNRIPLGWWYAMVRVCFNALSRAGNTRLGRPAWKPIEEWLENFLWKTADAARDGLEEDDIEPTVQTQGTESPSVSKGA